jgi:hypothetical protein
MFAYLINRIAIRLDMDQAAAANVRPEPQSG